MRYLIFGDGYIASKYKFFFKENSVITKRKVLNSVDVLEEIDIYKPEVVINCIGITGKPNIDWCEENKLQTIFGNVMVALYIEEACIVRNLKMVNIGTGCLYQGNHKFEESDSPNFQGGTYTRSKYLAEQSLGSDVLQLRIKMPIDGVINDKNLLTKLLKPKETSNPINSITIIPDLMKATEELVNKKAKGVINIVNPQPISNNQILEIYNKYSSRKKIIQEMSLDKFKSIVRVPRSHCTLNTDKLNSYGIYLRNTIEALETCIQEYVNEESSSVF